MADVFLSYVSEDREAAEKISDGLERNGLSVWWDRHIPGGVDFSEEIERQLGASRVAVVLWSSRSRNSEWVRDEAQQARDEGKLIPVRLDTTQPPLGFRQTQALDFSAWSGELDAAPFVRLVDSVRQFMGGTRDSGTRAINASFRPKRRRWGVSLSVSLAAAVLATAAYVGFDNWRDISPGLPGLEAPRGEAVGIEIADFEAIERSDELERLSKEATSAFVRAFSAIGIETIAGTRNAFGVPNSAGSADLGVRGRVSRAGVDLVTSVDVVDLRDSRVLWSTMLKADAERFTISISRLSLGVSRVFDCALTSFTLTTGAPTSLFGPYLRVCEAFITDIERAPELAQDLVDAAPRSAQAHATVAIANAYVSRTPMVSGTVRPRSEVARLRQVVYESAQRAVEIDPRFDPLLARAVVVDPSISLAQRERYLQQSYARDNQPGVVFEEGMLLEGVGRVRDAQVRIERALKQSPANERFRVERALLGAWLGKIEVARREFDSLREASSSPGFEVPRMWAEVWFGGDLQAARAISESVDGWELTRNWPCVRFVVSALADHSRPPDAEIERACPKEGFNAFGYFGAVDAVFRSADAFFQFGEVERPHSTSNDTRHLFMPYMKPVRADPRFMPLAARLGLVDYWVDTDQWPDFCATERLPYDCRSAALAARAERSRRT